jgi:2,4-dichlorophenol 6-monooxygenase
MDRAQPVRRFSITISCPDLFVLIACSTSSPWIAAAEKAAARVGIPVEIAVVADEGPVSDRSHAWRHVREVSDDGALLVRPDHIVAWRSVDARHASADEFEGVLRAVLLRTTRTYSLITGAE